MILLIDNFDSFTFNLAQIFQMQGVDLKVLRNDRPEILKLASSKELSGAVISPGPGHPAGAGLCLEFLKKAPQTLPVMGVCLGHQVLGHYSGAEVRRGPHIMHGKDSAITHDGRDLFKDLPNPMRVARYHSLLVFPQKESKLTITARTEEDEIMGLTYPDRPWMGVQFHPESVLTPQGPQLVTNFINICAQ